MGTILPAMVGSHVIYPNAGELYTKSWSRKGQGEGNLGDRPDRVAVWGIGLPGPVPSQHRENAGDTQEGVGEHPRQYYLVVSIEETVWGR